MMHFADAAAWESWLAEHHQTEGGVWLKITKKGASVTSVTAAQATEVALCYGWIDSHRKSYDQHCFLQRYSRRRRGSPWSQANVERVEALTAVGRMRPPGLAQVFAAQADGRWAAAYAAQRNATVPPDLAAALAAHSLAAARFEALGKTDRYRMILPLLTARTPAGRTARLQKAIADLLNQ
ncbi:MAG TPA: YdeI/OmpD-associated family protein [Micromonospora sp.]|nr:YdeI/OmpD-associated family protein [Micromonospora sp.]